MYALFRGYDGWSILNCIKNIEFPIKYHRSQLEDRVDLLNLIREDGRLLE